MGVLRFTHYALSVSAVAVLLSACGGSSSLAPVPGAVNNDAAPLLKSKTFHFTGGEQTFRVPGGVTSITIVARGAQGGGQTGGLGGRVYAVIPVHSREQLHVFVGGQGTDQNGGKGGFNGGGESGCYDSYVCGGAGGGYGGGGASDIRRGGSNFGARVIVAGGGGGEGGDIYDSHPPASGGKGGGSTGGTGASGCCYHSGGGGGGGGSPYQGGAGGYGGQSSYRNGDPGLAGYFGEGGAGGNDGCYYSNYCYNAGADGGGGGGGYYGGGGGGGGSGTSYFRAPGGGGGGGSSYIEPKATKYQSWQGWKNAVGDGLVVISWK